MSENTQDAISEVSSYISVKGDNLSDNHNSDKEINNILENSILFLHPFQVTKLFNENSMKVTEAILMSSLSLQPTTLLL